jgi:nitroreductase
MTINSMTAEVDIKLLKPHADNVNQGDVGAIVESIQRNGFYGRIVVNKRNNHILAGNHRYLAAKNLGFETIPVEYVDIDERDEVRLLLVDNRTTIVTLMNSLGCWLSPPLTHPNRCLMTINLSKNHPKSVVPLVRYGNSMTLN